jgi:hypothetical protein
MTCCQFLLDGVGVSMHSEQLWVRGSAVDADAECFANAGLKVEAMALPPLLAREHDGTYGCACRVCGPGNKPLPKGVGVLVRLKPLLESGYTKLVSAITLCDQPLHGRSDGCARHRAN